MQVFLLAAAVVVGCLVLVSVTIRRPMWGLALGGMLIYNPAFNYRFLFTHEFQGGSERALLSLGVLASLYLGVAISRSRSKASIPRPIKIPWQLSYVILVVMGAMVGLISGHDLRLVGSDLFPVIEFVAYFPLVGLACRNRDEAGRLAIILLIWGGLVAATEVGLYIIRGDLFASRFALNGGSTLIHRLDDFVPALLLPLGIAVAIQTGQMRLKLAATLVSVSLAVATALSFFRSLWAGLLVAIVLILVISFAGAVRRVAVTRQGAAALVAMISAAVVTLIVMASVKVSAGASLLTLIVSRIAHVESTSGSARVDDNLQLFSMLEAHPLGIGLGGMSGSGPLFSASDYYLSAAVELGLIGLLLLVAMGVSFLRLNYGRYQASADPLTRGIILGTIGSYTCMAVTLLTFPSLLHYPIPAYLAVLGGVVGVLVRSYADDPPIVDGDGPNWSQRLRSMLARRGPANSAR